MQLKSTAWIMAALMCGAAVAGVVGRPNTTAGELGGRDRPRNGRSQAASATGPMLPDQGGAGRQPADRGAARQALQPDPDAHLRQQGRLPDHAVDGLRRRPARRPAGASPRGLLPGAGLQAGDSPRTARWPTSFGDDRGAPADDEPGHAQRAGDVLADGRRPGDQEQRSTSGWPRSGSASPGRFPTACCSASRRSTATRRGRSRCSRSSPPT